MNEQNDQIVTTQRANNPLDALEETDEAVAGLTPAQLAAFEVMTSGGTIAAAARAGKVSRKSIYDWLEEGHRFAAAYEQWKQSIAETSRTRLLMVGEVATVQIARAIKQGDTRAALQVAKGMGLLSPPPVGPSMTQSIAAKKRAEAAKAEAQQRDMLSETPFKDLVDVERFQAEMNERDKQLSDD